MKVIEKNAPKTSSVITPLFAHRQSGKSLARNYPDVLQLSKQNQ